MTLYLLRRFLQTIPVLVLASIVVFLFIHLIPGDPALVAAGPDARPEDVAAMRRQMGLDAPLPVQYITWLGHVFQGDLGRSFVSKIPVWRLIGGALPATVELTLAALVIAIGIGIPSGILAAITRQRWPDWCVAAFNVLWLAVPNFYLGILLIILFSLVLGWLPPGGRIEFLQAPGVAWRFLLLPALTLGVGLSASISRFTRAAMIEVLHEDYVRTARAKGLPGRHVVIRHALRNALIPVVTILGIQFGRLLGGAVVVESVFAWPGVGRLILNAVVTRDYFVVQGALLLLVTAFVVINLFIDLLYGALDPRIVTSGGRR
ncbi:MAG TPA: ABC transporter permease [Chloroflexota bacterium]|jgi:ABC-type dipeptide/oligopeptide/nickel transport system permease component|nr:ABC transporter permease [Chloroflexota bacterium]